MARDLGGVLRVVAALQRHGLPWMASVGSREAMVQAMLYYMVRLDISITALPPVIHVAGTKGKGSTAALCESMLRHCGLRTGLYTSPHLVSVCERYKVNGAPVEEAKFLRQFWSTWDVLNASDQPICPPDLASEYGAPASLASTSASSSASSASSSSSSSSPPSPSLPAPRAGMPRMPPLPGFNLLTLVAFKLFVEEAVDVLVLEVGLGGRLDATNVVSAPAVCGVTTLDFDHVELLGHTLPAIAAEKAGIFKPGVPAVTAPQRADALARLAEVAGEVGAPLYVADVEALAARCAGGRPPVLGLEGAFQRTNAALAVALVDVFMAQVAAGRVALGDGVAAAVLAAYDGTSRRQPADLTPPRASPRPPRRPSFLDTFGASTRPAPGAPPPAYDHRTPLSPALLAGLAATRWPGRAQVLTLDARTGRVATADALAADGAASPGGASAAAAAAAGAGGGASPSVSPPHVHLYLDGAHTERSMVEAARWFLGRLGGTPPGGRRRRTVLVFNCGAEKDALQLLLPLSAIDFADVHFTTVAWNLSPRTDARNAGEALRSWVAKKRDMDDVAALADLRAGCDAVGVSWEDVVDGRGDAAWTAEPAPLPPSLAAMPGSNPSLLLWQRTLQSLHTAARVRPELAVLRTRMAAAVGLPPPPSPAAAAAPAAAAPPAYHVFPTAAAVLGDVCARAAADPGTEYHVFVTGSLYLVGAALESAGAVV